MKLLWDTLCSNKPSKYLKFNIIIYSFISIKKVIYNYVLLDVFNSRHI